MSVLVFYFVELSCFRWRIPPHSSSKVLAVSCYSSRIWWGVKVAHSNTAPLLLGWEFIPLILRHESSWKVAILFLQDRLKHPRGSSCSSFLPVCVRLVRRRTASLTTSRLKPSPAGACCEAQPRGPSWPRAERLRLGSGASGWGGSPAVCAAPDVSVVDPPLHSHW